VYEDIIRAEIGNEGIEFVEVMANNIERYVLGKGEAFSVTHGDFRLDNLLFATEQGGVPCAVVDWQTPGHGNGISDLAYFIGAGLLPDDRRRFEWELVDQYIRGIESYGHEIDQEWVKFHYKREAISGVIMAVIASQIVGRTERGDKMFEVMATRHIQQGLENGALSLL
jgi:aminoglycoside phosphotransferase (APT) family kinase protein